MAKIAFIGLGRMGHGMDSLSVIFLGHQPISYDEVTGTGKARLCFDQVPIDKATEYAAEDADVTAVLDPPTLDACFDLKRAVARAGLAVDALDEPGAA